LSRHLRGSRPARNRIVKGGNGAELIDAGWTWQAAQFSALEKPTSWHI
jgi:hypothetical protein